MPPSLPVEEYVSPGHLACQGCGGVLAMRYALKALGPDTIVDIPACCWSVIAGPFPNTALKVPLFHTAFETAASVASGIRAGTRVRGEDDKTVLAWAGDGGTFDIGIQSLSAAAERNDDIIYVVYDNEAYMNTGIQRSSSTPFGAWTTTTPSKHYKKLPKKDIVRIMAAHRIPYIATCSVAYPEDFIRKFKKAKTIRGTRFFYVLAPCPVGWRAQPAHLIKIARLAVQTCLAPLIEIYDGTRWTISKQVKKPKPIEEYLSLQGRFKHLQKEQIGMIQRYVDDNWREIRKLAEASKLQAPEGETEPAEESRTVHP